MWFRTSDGTLRHPEVLMYIAVLRHHQMYSVSGYSADIHNVKDGIVEAWLKGEIRIFETKEEAIQTLNAEAEVDRKQKKDYVV